MNEGVWYTLSLISLKIRDDLLFISGSTSVTAAAENENINTYINNNNNNADCGVDISQVSKG